MKDNQQDINIAELKKDVKYIKQSLEYIKERVSNHLPHRIEELREDLIAHEKADAKALAKHEKADLKWKLTALGGIVALLATTLFNTFIK